MKRVTLLVAVMMLSGCSGLAEGENKRALDYRLMESKSAYELARTKNDNLGMCIDAARIRAAYLDLHDEPSAGAWAARRRDDCLTASSTVRSYWDAPASRRTR